MKKRENEALERYKSLHENRLRLAQEEMRKINESAEARQSFINNYHAIRDRQALKEVQRSKLMEAARNDALATVIKAIYITALEAESLMDENILLAENMVDKWIEEAGGASKILAKTGNNTYLLSRITQIVEEAAEDAVKEIEEPDEEPKTDEVPDENASKDVQIAQLTAKEAEIKAQIANLKAEKKAEDEEEKSEEEAEKDAEPAAEEDSKEDEDGKETSDTPDEEVPAEGEEKSEEESETNEDDKEESDTSDEEAPAEDGESEEEVDSDMEIKDVPAEDSENTEELPKEDEEKSDEKSEDAPEEAEGEESTADGAADETTPTEDKVEDSTESEESEDAPEEAEGEEGSDEEDADPDSDIDMNDDEKELTDGDEVDPDEDASEDDDVEDALGEPIDGDNSSDTDTTVDGDTENKGKIFDDLENEDDVQKAIELIRTRVADAEETFIRNNAEDKKKIDELLTKISTNVKTVETMAEKDPKKAQVATEAVREYKRKINDVYKEKSFTVFGKMTSILTESIVKDDAIRESYTTEDGTLDVDLAVESAKVMYGFLETLNTIQIEKVDEKYIANIIDGMR